MKLATNFLTAGVVAILFFAGCEIDTPTTAGEPSAAVVFLTLDRPSIDTVVTASPGAFISLHNNITPSDPDTTRTYVWEVIHGSSFSTSWQYSICDPQSCGSPMRQQSEFIFAHGIPGFFWVDWINSDVALDDMGTGPCSLSVMVFPKDGGDTTYYSTVMQVTK